MEGKSDVNQADGGKGVLGPKGSRAQGGRGVKGKLATF